jgi:ABC-type phosphate transport system substrate-binding protein
MIVQNCLKFSARSAPALLVVALAASMTSVVRADDCSTLPNPVFVAGSSASKLFVASVAAELRQQTPPITVVYQSQGSCAGVNLLSSDTNGTLTGTGVIFGNDGKDIPGGCALTGNPVDVGVSDVYAVTCGVDKLPANVKDFYGPVQAMTFVVPMASSQSIISAEAAYLVYGFGNDSEVSPWTDETKIEQRSATSGTQQMIASYIKVPAAKFKGHPNMGSGDLVTSLAASATAGNADSAIGILATDSADKNRASLKILGYQHYNQSCAYWPDSTATAFDKANVRDGHYPIWGPLHMLSRTENGEVSSPNVKKLLAYLTGAETPTGFDLIQVEAKNGVVPGCAMRVARTKDGGDLMSFMPDKSCECKFIKEATGAAPDSCKSCDMSSDCPSSAPVCNYNFCEVK